jgi:signal peptidase I
MKLKRALAYTASTLAFAVVAIYVWNPLHVPSWDPRGRVLGVIPYRMPATSMLPTIPRNHFVVACTASYWNAVPAVGDIIVFKSPPEFEVPYVKRVVALAGDRVEFRGDQYIRNGVVRNEPYLQPDHNYESLETVVPEASVFVAGDNREHSMDSRHFGPVPTCYIIGKLCAGI